MDASIIIQVVLLLVGFVFLIKGSDMGPVVSLLF